MLVPTENTNPKPNSRRGLAKYQPKHQTPTGKQVTQIEMRQDPAPASQILDLDWNNFTPKSVNGGPQGRAYVSTYWEHEPQTYQLEKTQNPPNAKHQTATPRGMSSQLFSSSPQPKNAFYILFWTVVLSNSF